MTTLGARWADQPHGTLAAYRRHYRYGEKPCESCKQANSRHWQDIRNPRKEARRRALRLAA